MEKKDFKLTNKEIVALVSVKNKLTDEFNSLSGENLSEEVRERRDELASRIVAIGNTYLDYDLEEVFAESRHEESGEHGGEV